MRRVLYIGVVLAILGFVTFVVVPNLLKAMNRSREARTMADIRAVATAWEARANDAGSYTIFPDHFAVGDHDMANFARTGRVTSRDLERALVPTYVRALPKRDGWGNEFDFRTGDHDKNRRAQGYAIRSFGSNGRPDATVYDGRMTSTPAVDIVYVNGAFLSFPEGL